MLSAGCETMHSATSLTAKAAPRTIYLKRLQMCRNLFNYLLEVKEKKSQ
jgi:hypothetical protein